VSTTLFKNGGSQAMRIPAAFRFDGDTVDVEWDESLGALIVRSEAPDAWNHLFSLLRESGPGDTPPEVPLDENGRFDVAAFMDYVA
jgi:antitoxin VapB